MNSTLFKDHPTKDQESADENWRHGYKVGIRLHKPRFHAFQDTLRKISGLSWAVLVPTALGAVLGLWVDTLWPATGQSWFRIMFPLGAFVGCLTAIIWGYQDPGAN
jgi:predicted F0F1-ATPase subunit